MTKAILKLTLDFQFFNYLTTDVWSAWDSNTSWVTRNFCFAQYVRIRHYCPLTNLVIGWRLDTSSYDKNDQTFIVSSIIEYEEKEKKNNFF